MANFGASEIYTENFFFHPFFYFLSVYFNASVNKGEKYSEEKVDENLLKSQEILNFQLKKCPSWVLSHSVPSGFSSPVATSAVAAFHFLEISARPLA